MKEMKLTKQVSIILVIVLVSLMTVGTAAFLAPRASADVGYAYYSADTSYSDDNGTVVEQYSFAYDHKEVQLHRINTTYPEFYNTNNALTNTCANIAGANIVGFYDRYYDELIPDSTAGVVRPNGYTYYPMSLNRTQKQAVIDELYVSMGTNTVQPGTSQPDFEEGLADYVTSRSRNISYSSVMTNGVLDQTKYSAQFAAGYPVALFLSGYNVTVIMDSNGTISITQYNYTGNHIMVAFGYEIITYYDANNNVIRSYTLMVVASGSSLVKGYYVLNEGGSVNAAEAVIIS